MAIQLYAEPILTHPIVIPNAVRNLLSRHRFQPVAEIKNLLRQVNGGLNNVLQHGFNTSLGIHPQTKRQNENCCCHSERSEESFEPPPVETGG